MLIFVLVIGLVFSYINGMHDGSTIVATAISSKLLPPKKLILLAGLANMIGSLTMGSAVALTIYSGIIRVNIENSYTSNIFVLSSLLGTIIWNAFTWKISLPSSASHSMIGAMIGSGIAAYGIYSVVWSNIFVKVILAMFISPFIGFFISLMFFCFAKFALGNATIMWNRIIFLFHCLSSFFLALSYGGNDSQKVAGLLAIALISKGVSGFEIPYWLMISVGFCLSLGTVTGGYNMVKTVGFDITRVDMHNSCASQMSTALVLLFSNIMGLPISATQVVSASVIGVGTAYTPKSVNWSIAKKTITAWIITIPVSAIAGFVIYKCFFLTPLLIGGMD